MNNNKRPWQSKTMWGGVMMLVALVLSAGFGIEFTPDDQAAFTDKALSLAEAAFGFGGFAVVLYGRLTAGKSITLLPSY